MSASGRTAQLEGLPEERLERYVRAMRAVVRESETLVSEARSALEADREELRRCEAALEAKRAASPGMSLPLEEIAALHGVGARF